MESQHTYLFLDKPETLETVTFSLHKYYGEIDGRTVPDTSSLRISYGCFLSSAFDKELEYKTYKGWENGQARLNEALQHWKDKGFKSRKELGIIDKDDNLCHDEIVKSIRKQLMELYFAAMDKQANIPEWRKQQIANEELKK